MALFTQRFQPKKVNVCCISSVCLHKNVLGAWKCKVLKQHHFRLCVNWKMLFLSKQRPFAPAHNSHVGVSEQPTTMADSRVSFVLDKLYFDWRDSQSTFS